MPGETLAQNLLGGDWLWPDDAPKIHSVNPANRDELVCIAPESGAAEVDCAVAAARNALDSWRRTPPPARAAIIARAGQLLREWKQELGALVTRECGKPIAEGRGDVQEAIDMADLSSGEGRRLYGDTTTSELPSKLCMTVREPIGVCALISPWNFPIAIPAWKALAALICGNTLIFKPAEDTPLCGVEFVRALQDAGLPDGVMNLVHGTGEVTGEAIVAHQGIDMVSFTGSSETGRRIAEICGRTGKRVSLECGGKNAQIVADDADLALALDGALWGAFGTAGQRCTATSRLILHDGIHDEFVEMLLERVVALRLGPGLEESTDVCPLVNQQQFERVMSYIQVGQDEGAELLCGGRRAAGGKLDNGYFIEPTIFGGVTRTMRIFQEEIFGPVLSVIRVSDLDEAIATLNDSQYGLSSSIYTQDVNKAMRATREIQAGIVYVNGPTIGAEVHLPFGGVKSTGNGHREAGRVGLDTFSEWKTIYIDYSGRLQRAQLDTADAAGAKQ